MIASFNDENTMVAWECDITDSDIKNVVSTWYIDDELLVGLSSSPSFENKTAWSDLSKDNIYTLILHCFSKIRADDSDKKIERLEEPYSSFKFLTGVLIRHLELNGVSGFDRVNITRNVFGKLTVKFSLQETFSIDTIKPAPVFKIVVDNEKYT